MTRTLGGAAKFRLDSSIMFAHHPMGAFIRTAVAGLTLASAAAYAQMRHGSSKSMQQEMMGGMPMHGAMMHGGMSGMMSGGSHRMAGDDPPKGDTGPSSLAYQGINKKMHGAMD